MSFPAELTFLSNQGYFFNILRAALFIVCILFAFVYKRFVHEQKF